MTQSDVPVDREPAAPLLPELAEQFGALMGSLIGRAVMGATSMGDHAACERRPWPAPGVCGAVLLANVDATGRKQVHYCHADLDLHVVDTEHVCVCGQDWAEQIDGVATVAGPGETVVRPREQP